MSFLFLNYKTNLIGHYYQYNNLHLVKDMVMFLFIVIYYNKGKPFLVVIGGNTGTTPVNDVWILNIERV